MYVFYTKRNIVGKILVIFSRYFVPPKVDRARKTKICNSPKTTFCIFDFQKVIGDVVDYRCWNKIKHQKYVSVWYLDNVHADDTCFKAVVSSCRELSLTRFAIWFSLIWPRATGTGGNSLWLNTRGSINIVDLCIFKSYYEYSEFSFRNLNAFKVAKSFFEHFYLGLICETNFILKGKYDGMASIWKSLTVKKHTLLAQTHFCSYRFNSFRFGYMLYLHLVFCTIATEELRYIFELILFHSLQTLVQSLTSDQIR